MTSPWNSLEIAKLIVGAATPILLLLLGIWVHRLGKRFEATQWASQKVIEKRLVVYDQTAPLLNDIYCFFMWFGNWKELTPPQVIATKRKLDKIVYVNAFLFSPEFVTTYRKYADLCFETYSTRGGDARLRTDLASADGDRRKVSVESWDPRWEEMFSPRDKHSTREDIQEAYQNLMSYLARELGIRR